MTVEERAGMFIQKWYGDPCISPHAVDGMRQDFIQALQDQIEECAKACDEEAQSVPKNIKTYYADGYKAGLHIAAEQIRALAEEKEEVKANDIEERANDVVESMGNEATMRHLWAIKIKKAIITAIEEDRKTRPHRFVGRHDRYCESCNEPDRHEIHLVPREWVDNAMNQEREALLQIVKAEEEYGEQNRINEYACAARAIKGKIKARSEGEQQKGDER